MKKLLLFALTLATTPLVHGQWMQNQHKTVVFVREWALCADSYNDWSIGLLDTLGDIQNTPAFPALMMQYDTGPTEGKTELFWKDAFEFSKNNSPSYGNQPAFAVDNIGVSILPHIYGQYYMAPEGLKYLHRKAIDTLYRYVKQLTTSPAVVSVGFTKATPAPDSVVIRAKTRFNVNTTGTYMVSVYAVEDSAMGFMACSTSSEDTFAHRWFLRKSIQFGIWGRAVLYDTVAAAGAEYTHDFAYRIPASWNKEKLSYVMVVFKIAADGRKYIMNATNGNVGSAAGVLNTDVTEGITVYPVPAQDYLTIEARQGLGMSDCDIALYDINGRRVASLYTGTLHSGTPQRVSLPTGLAPGNYMLQLHNETMSAVKQVSIK